MEVILLQRVPKLGQMGETVRVKDGYARNFLLPSGKALRATKANKERFDNERVQLEAHNLEAKKDAETVAGKLNGKSFIVIRQAGESGQLYGSVSARDVVEAVEAHGGKVERSAVVLDKPIKTLGMHEVKIRLHAEVAVTVTLNIARSQDEADRQAKGENVIASQFEEDRLADQEAQADLLEGGAGSIQGDYVEA
jgi:large subunit ribosomal protein L9